MLPVIAIRANALKLLKTSLINGIAVAVKMAALLIINKILAFSIGPTDYALLGQFQNVMQLVNALASGSINSGVTKYTAEYHADEEKLKLVWKTAGMIAILSSLLVGLIVFIYKNELAVLFLNDKNLGFVFGWCAIALIFFVVNTLMLAMLNGKKEINFYVISNIIGSIFTVAAVVLMVNKWGLNGALISLAVYQSLSFFITLALCCRTKWFKVRYLYGLIDNDMALKLLKYGIMALTTAICVPVTQVVAREYIGGLLGWNFAGYWEAMTRFSSAYLMFITSTLAVYYLPRISELKLVGEIHKEVVSVYKLFLPIVLISSALIYIFRNEIIELLFSKEFLGMSDLFGWQVVGDALKICAWIISYMMLSKSMVKTYILTEIIFSFVFVLLFYVCVDKYGFVGASIAHALNYVAYLLAMYLFVYKKVISEV